MSLQTSEIEGELLNPELVRSSIATRLGLEYSGLENSDRSVDGIVELMIDATQNDNKVLTEDRLFGWHAVLFPTARSGMHKLKLENGAQVLCKLFQVVWEERLCIMKLQKQHFCLPK